jgi:hypothetical protein
MFNPPSVAWGEGGEHWAGVRVVVNAVRCRELDARDPLSSELGWRHVVAAAEGAREGLVRLVPRAERDVRYAGRGVRQPPRRSLHAKAAHQLHRRFADHAAEYPVEMER